MVADCRADESEILAAERADSAGPSGGDVLAADVSFDVVRVSESVLQLALPDRDFFGAFVASREESIWAEFQPAALDRSAVARTEVFFVGVFCVGDFDNVRGGHSRFY